MAPPPLKRSIEPATAAPVAPSVAGDSEAGSVMPADKKARTEDVQDTAFPVAPPEHGIGVGLVKFNVKQPTIPIGIMADPEFRLESALEPGAFDARNIKKHYVFAIDCSASMGHTGDPTGVPAAEATAQTLEALKEFLCKSLENEPEECRPGGPNEPTITLLGFAGSAGFADVSEKWLDQSTAQDIRGVKDARDWARDSFHQDDLKHHTLKVSECLDACLDWASRMRGIVYPKNQLHQSVPGFNGDGAIGGCTNLGAAFDVSTEVALRLCATSGGIARVIIATDGLANRGRTSADQWRDSIQNYAMQNAHKVGGFPVSYCALMMGASTNVEALGKLTHKKGVLSYAKAPEDIQTALGAVFNVVSETSRGAFDAVVLATYEAYVNDAWVEVRETAVTYLNAGELYGDNYEFLADVLPPDINSPVADPLATPWPLTSSYPKELRVKLTAYVAPSLHARIRRGRLVRTLHLDDLKKKLADLKLPAYEAIVPVDAYDSKNYCRRAEYVDFPTPLDLVEDPEYEDTASRSLFNFIKRNLHIEEVAFEQLSKARTYEETAMISRSLAREATTQGSQRLARRFGTSARRSETIAQTIAEGGEEAAVYRGMSAAHSAAAAYSQTVGDEEGDEDDLHA